MLFAVKRFGVNLQFVWWKKASQKKFYPGRQRKKLVSCEGTKCSHGKNAKQTFFKESTGVTSKTFYATAVACFTRIVDAPSLLPKNSVLLLIKYW